MIQQLKVYTYYSNYCVLLREMCLNTDDGVDGTWVRQMCLNTDDGVEGTWVRQDMNCRI